MSVAFKCDRCGGFEAGKPNWLLGLPHVAAPWNHQIELCTVCTKELVQWAAKKDRSQEPSR
jgi:hypothetical protein